MWFVGLLVAVIGVAALAIRRFRANLPPPDHPFGFDFDRTQDHQMITPPPDPNWQPVVIWYTFEKVALVSMVTTIFALVIPDNTVSFAGVVVPVAFVIVVNAFASTWFTRRGQDWESIGKEFVTMAAVNVASALVFIVLLRQSDESVNEAATVFFVLLLTLIVTLFDRYHGTGAKPRQDLPLT